MSVDSPQPRLSSDLSQFELSGSAVSILFGVDTTERIVAVEPGDRTLRIWRRLADDSVELTEESFHPWALLTSPHPMLPGAPTELEGDGFRFLYEFPSWGEFLSAHSFLRDQHVESLAYSNGAKQALVRCGKTLFKGMKMSDVVRMQVDIETTTLAPEASDARILIIAVGDNRGLLETLTGDERDVLEQLMALILDRDPDILEGHNIYGFDIPYLIARARKHNIRLALGRDGSEPRVGRQRNFAIGGNTRPFSPVWIYGRHVLDTYLAVQRFDWARGMLTSFGLKQVARALGIAEEDRVEMPRDRLEQIYREDPERVLTYARHDIVETARLAEIVAPTEFYMAQMVPDTFGSAAVTGMGEKINSIFIRAYLAQGHAIPRPQPQISVAGGHTEIRLTGVIDRVVKADVESLYPSIMLTEGIAPASDSLGVFLPALGDLTRRRLDAKSRMKEARGPDLHYWDGLQGSFKVLINSFYGYLGANTFHFNDYDAAGRITELGRKFVIEIADRIEATSGRVIEIDTDGVYFVPPEGVEGEEAERAYVVEIGSALPQGIRLAFDGRYKAMVSLKTKNYVLHAHDGSTVFKGASLRSRADEAFGREFIVSAVDLLLQRRLEDVAALYRATIDDILNRRVPIEKLARRERVTEKTRTSANKQRSAAVVGETSIGEYITVYERVNGDLALLEEYDRNGRDENAEYYMDKLYKFACRLREAFEADFDRLIPRPTSQGITVDLQETLDLFA